MTALDELIAELRSYYGIPPGFPSKKIRDAYAATESELARLRAVEADYERAIQALKDIANGDHCDNDGRGCSNEDIAFDTLQLLERAA